MLHAPLPPQTASPGAVSPATSATRWAMLSLGAALVTLALKFAAYKVTGSVGLLSDAVETCTNVVAAGTALIALWYAARPADSDHPYGHEKIEFFSSGIEGALICATAISIAIAAYNSLSSGNRVSNIEVGVLISLLAAAINFAVARGLLGAGRRLHSIALEADGQHLMSDVWTSLGVALGLVLVRATGLSWIDPLLAALVAINIARIGASLCRRSFDGLMDHALEEHEVASIRAAIEGLLEPGEAYHALRTRRAGSLRLVDYHLLVPGHLPVQQAHDREMQIGHAITQAVGQIEITAHIEPIEEPAAWNDARVE